MNNTSEYNRKSNELKNKTNGKINKINELVANEICTEARSIAALFMTLEYLRKHL